MKAPINFSKRLNFYELEVDGECYEITTQSRLDNMLWISPKDKSASLTPNCISLLFDWEKEEYDIIVIDRLSGHMDYSRSIKDLGFSPYNFKTFDSFIQCTSALIRDHKELFN